MKNDCWYYPSQYAGMTKLKIIETSTGFRCRVCGRRFRTEEAAFVHQSYDCSQMKERKG